MTITARAIQLTDVSATISWLTTEVDPPLGFSVFREINAGGELLLGSVTGSSRAFLDPEGSTLAEGDLVAYRVEDLSSTLDDTAQIVWEDLTTPPTFGPVDPLATTARYTTVLLVKARLRIPIANADFDDRILQAIISGEYGLDAMLGRSFPDPAPDGQIQGIPIAVREAATSIATSVYKMGDAPTGVAGSDSFIGAFDVAEAVRSEINRNPVLMGFKVGEGFGIA